MSALPNVTIELIPDEEQGGFTSHVPYISAYGEGETEEEAIADLKEAMQLYVEEVGLEKTLQEAVGVFTIRTMNLGELVVHR